MLRRLGAVCILLAVTQSPALSGQQPTENQDPSALHDSVVQWFQSNLPEFGKFAMRLISAADNPLISPRVTNQLASQQSEDLRHRIIEVALEGCQLSFTSLYERTTAPPMRYEWFIPLVEVDTATVRVQVLEMPEGLSTQQLKSEVYMRTIRGELFIVVPPDRGARQSQEARIPIGRKNDAREVAEMLIRSVHSCRSAIPTG